MENLPMSVDISLDATTAIALEVGA